MGRRRVLQQHGLDRGEVAQDFAQQPHDGAVDQAVGPRALLPGYDDVRWQFPLQALLSRLAQLLLVEDEVWGSKG